MYALVIRICNINELKRIFPLIIQISSKRKFGQLDINEIDYLNSIIYKNVKIEDNINLKTLKIIITQTKIKVTFTIQDFSTCDSIELNTTDFILGRNQIKKIYELNSNRIKL